MKNNLLEDALFCREQLGFSFTPLKGKIPKKKGWQNAPLESVEDLQKWSSKGNLGLRTGVASGGLFVIDLDCSKPDYNIQKVKALNLPATVTVQTGSGGYHLYYRLPVGVDFGNSANKIAPCVDTRGTGGQVVFAGSIHPDSKRTYRFMPGKSPAEIALAELPENVIDLLSQPASQQINSNFESRNHLDKRTVKYVQNAMFSEMDKVANSQSGSRNDNLNSAAYSLGQLIAGGLLDEQTAVNNLRSSALSAGLSESEITRTINNGLTAGKKEPRYISNETLDANLTNQSAPGTAINSTQQVIPSQPLIDDYESKLGQRDSVSGKLILSTIRTLPTAKAYVEEFESAGNCRTLHSYNEFLFQWKDNRYSLYEYEALKNRLHQWLHDALLLAGTDKKPILKPFPGNPITVSQALQTITFATHLDGNREVPFYVSGDNSKPNPRELVCCQNCNLHVPTMQEFPLDPDLFNYNSLSFDFDRNADYPVAWEKFLLDIWPDDSDAVQLLKEWFGYCITADTSLQKMLFIQGPSRSGKGTIARILQELIGKQNYVAPTTTTLGSQYGLAEFIGKSLACVSDARFAGADLKVIVERLLNISGEDTLTIERKYKSAVTMKLPLRLMFLSNELPQLPDAAGALTNRFLVLTQTRTFKDKEDPTLTNRLLNELPGILLWAVEGWHDLHDRGKFKIPESSSKAMQELEELVSPIQGFIRDCCLVEESKNIDIQELFHAYCSWAEKTGRKFKPTVQSFGRDLSAALPELGRGQRSTGARYYKNIGLKPHWDLLFEPNKSIEPIDIPD